MPFSRTASVHSIALCMLPVLLAQGCMAHYGPPPKPEPIVPEVEAAPDKAPPEGSGRLVVDVAGEKAKVARVVDTVEPSYPYAYRGPSRYGNIGEQRRTELLCITPCIVDLRRGAHTLVFTSVEDGSRTSSADVVVSSEPSVVRHALGHNKPFSSPYVGGLALTLVGGGLTTIGAFATTIGLVAKSPQDDPTGRTQGDPKVFLALGLVMLGIGVALGTTGIIMASGDRPAEQPGSTIQWTPPRSVGPSSTTP